MLKMLLFMFFKLGVAIDHYRIINGSVSTIEEFPYLLSLERYGEHVCGASIIAQRVALTAAHCIYATKPEALTVRAGSTLRSSDGQLVRVKRVYVHPEFNKDKHNFDVGVMALKKKIQFGNAVKPIALISRTERVYYRGTSTVAGWGLLTPNSTVLSSELRAVEIEAVSHSNCKRKYSEVNLDITKEMICFVPKKGNQDSCQGDSGGPLVIENKQIGIVSWGVRCGEVRYPGVYSKIVAFRGFIDKFVDCIQINACPSFTK